VGCGSIRSGRAISGGDTTNVLLGGVLVTMGVKKSSCQRFHVARDCGFCFTEVMQLAALILCTFNTSPLMDLRIGS